MFGFRTDGYDKKYRKAKENGTIMQKLRGRKIREQIKTDFIGGKEEGERQVVEQ